jgi:chromosomal replication initiation ATPase DnaA
MCDAFKVLHHNCDKFTASKTAIVAAIESVSKITLEQIRSKSRNRKIVDARKVLCGLLDERESMNSVEIADYIGCHLSSGLPDHPTALHHIRTDKVLKENNPAYREFRNQITKWI